EVAYSFEVADPRVEFTAAAGSRLYWRVRSLAGGGEESEWSLPFVFTVTNLVANEPPPAEPTRSLLGVPFPNPARGTVTVPFTLDAARAVTLRVYDVTGRLVATLAEGQPFAAGAHALRFDADALPAGVYAVRLEAGREAEARRVVLLR
ncbi:MAG TPA: T9SS type A sorting domain-containing protein, partial [Rubricoccaceae bacterium]|nr:T9SS type A sorting domain-containing protein [Rubricoccaceae bacterium]